MPSNEQARLDALPSGAVLRDYRIEEVLGHGGFGIVYLARHNELDNLVAIKEYLPVELALREGATVQIRSKESRGRYEEGLRRFLDEAKALIGFHDCPGIVSCRDFFRCNSTAYLVMEYEQGLPLSDLLQQREAVWRPFEESDLLAVMVPLLEGLARVHEAGVLHRDIKPANILVRRADERPVLIDFGAAKQAVAEHSKSMAPYTEGYAAWEQIGEGALGPWTDMYAVGAVMWRMVAGGNPPWEPPNPVKVEKRANAVLRGGADPLPAARELGAGRFSPPVLDAVDRCLKLKEEERVRDSVELLGLLHGESGTVAAPAALQPQADQPSELEEQGRPEELELREGAFEPALPSKEWSNKQRVGLAAAVCLAVALIAALLLMRNDASEFRIGTYPEYASVKLLNSDEPYWTGMRLAPGRYEVEVRAPGYQTRREEVEHGELVTSHWINLERETADLTPLRPPGTKGRQSPARRRKPVADLPRSKDAGDSGKLLMPDPIDQFDSFTEYLKSIYPPDDPWMREWKNRSKRSAEIRRKRIKESRPPVPAPPLPPELVAAVEEAERNRQPQATVGRYAGQVAAGAEGAVGSMASGCASWRVFQEFNLVRSVGKVLSWTAPNPAFWRTWASN